MHTVACICAHIPELHLRTEVVVVQHHSEARKTTETAHLLVEASPSCRIVSRGMAGVVLPPDLFADATRRTWLLFPGEDANVLDETLVSADPRPITLVVPDGTWRQAAKAVRRDPSLQGLTQVTLPDLGPSRYLLREAPRSGQLATLEAIGRALGIIEGSEVREALEALLEVMVRRTLKMRGQQARSGRYAAHATSAASRT